MTTDPSHEDKFGALLMEKNLLLSQLDAIDAKLAQLALSKLTDSFR